MKNISVKNKQIFVFSMLFFTIIGFSNGLAAQQHKEKNDTISIFTIEEVVVTASRFENKIFNSGTAVYMLRQNEIKSLPSTQLSTTLQYLPGLFSASYDGLGLNPMFTVRGFHGGGESEYLKVLVDGIPINNTENGLVNWNMIPLNHIKQIEVINGGASSLYGDAAMGGVINLITNKNIEKYTHAAANYGGFNAFSAEVSHGNNLDKGFFDIYANYNKTDGFRNNGNWQTINFGGKIKYPVGEYSSLTIHSANHILSMQNPGPLTQNIIDVDQSISKPYFRNDGKDLNNYMISADWRSTLSDQTDLNVSLSYQYKDTEESRTFVQPSLILSMPDFTPIGVYDTTMYGNTKNRILATNQALFAARVFNQNKSGQLRIAGGVELDYGGFDNKVYDVFKGFEADYKNHFNQDNDLDFSGDGYRLNAASYFNGELNITNSLKLIAGLRYDLINDVFESSFPVADTTLNKTYHAISPKIALNLNTTKNDYYEGSFFVSFSNAFKAPTLDQRTDLKTLNYAMFFAAGPSYQMTIINASPFSNAELKPQYSTNYEIGTYQQFKLSDRLLARANLTLYLIDVKNEIDFDLAEFRYRNISSSSHTGIETSVSLQTPNNLRGFANFNFSEAKIRSGQNKGNFINAVPRFYYHGGLSYLPDRGFGAGITMNRVKDIYLDDDNTVELEPYTSFNARINYNFNHLSIYLDIQNIFDNQYNTTGYTLYGETFLYPAAGRFFRSGISVRI